MSETARRPDGQTARGSTVLSDFSTSRPLDSQARTVKLRRAIADLRATGEEGRQARQQEQAEPVDLTPKSAHEAITRQMVTDLAADVAEVKTRVNAVLWLGASAAGGGGVVRLAGGGGRRCGGTKENALSPITTSEASNHPNTESGTSKGGSESMN